STSLRSNGRVCRVRAAVGARERAARTASSHPLKVLRDQGDDRLSRQGQLRGTLFHNDLLRHSYEDCIAPVAMPAETSALLHPGGEACTSSLQGDAILPEESRHGAEDLALAQEIRLLGQLFGELIY